MSALALQELERLGYSSRSRSRYHTTWRRLIAFAQDNDLGDRYSEELAGRFVDVSRPRGGEHPAAGAQRHAALAVNVLGDFNRDGRIAPFYTDMLKVVLPPAMKTPLRDYERYCKDRRHLRPRTLAGRIRQIAQFLHFLHSRDVRRLQEMQPADVAAFIVSRQHFRPGTVSWIVSCLRQFLRFLVMRGHFAGRPQLCAADGSRRAGCRYPGGMGSGGRRQVADGRRSQFAKGARGTTRYCC